jgi:hypothetical protein
MKKQTYLLLLFGISILLVGCTLNPALLSPTQTPLPVQINTPEPLVTYVTATSLPPTDTVVVETPTQIPPTLTLTPVPPNASITITGVDDLGGGQALVHWTNTGDFPSGFIVVWSTTDQIPAYPTDSNIAVTDPSSDSAMIPLSIRQIYYLRVCRNVNNSCDVYSNLEIFALFNSATSTPVPSTTAVAAPTLVHTVMPTAYDSNGKAISSTISITITDISDGGSGKARISWKTTGTFSGTFAIVYSQSFTAPYVGGYPYYVVSNSTRVAYVEGDSGVKYYYRVCELSGSTCDIYSNSVSYTYP